MAVVRGQIDEEILELGKAQGGEEVLAEINEWWANKQ